MASTMFLSKAILLLMMFPDKQTLPGRQPMLYGIWEKVKETIEKSSQILFNFRLWRSLKSFYCFKNSKNDTNTHHFPVNALPAGIGGKIYGLVITQMNEYGCNAMLVSGTNLQVQTCFGQYQWSVSPTKAVNGLMVKLDINLFFLWRFIFALSSRKNKININGVNELRVVHNSIVFNCT